MSHLPAPLTTTGIAATFSENTADEAAAAYYAAATPDRGGSKVDEAVDMSRRAKRRLALVSVGALALVAAVVPLLGAQSAAAAPVPAFVQAVSARKTNATSLAVTPTNPLTTAGRLVVEVGVWSSAGATTSTVTDTAGDPFTELTHYKAADGTEQSIWTAPVTTGATTRPTITAKTTSTADIGITTLEYTGLSTATDATAVDTQTHTTGLTGTATTNVASGPTTPTTTPNELAIGFYTDSGFSDTLTANTNWTPRTNISPTSDMELLTEDQITTTTAATPNATVTTGRATYWLMATIVFKHA